MYLLFDKQGVRVLHVRRERVATASRIGAGIRLAVDDDQIAAAAPERDRVGIPAGGG